MMIDAEFKIPLIEDFKRTVICHPDNELFFKSCIISNDIQLLTSRYMPIKTAVYTKDCIVEFEPRIGYVCDDFENKLFTLKTNYTIK